MHFLLFLVGVGLIGGAVFGYFWGALSLIGAILIGIFGLLPLLLVFGITLFTSFYRKTAANMAIVRFMLSPPWFSPVTYLTAAGSGISTGCEFRRTFCRSS